MEMFTNGFYLILAQQNSNVYAMLSMHGLVLSTVHLPATALLFNFKVGVNAFCRSLKSVDWIEYFLTLCAGEEMAKAFAAVKPHHQSISLLPFRILVYSLHTQNLFSLSCTQDLFHSEECLKIICNVCTKGIHFLKVSFLLLCM